MAVSTDEAILREVRAREPNTENHRWYRAASKRPYQCATCRRHFAYLSHRDEHELSHVVRGSAPPSAHEHKCWDCPLAYDDPGDLYDHVRARHPRRLFR